MRTIQYSFLALVILVSSVACKNVNTGGLFGRFDRARYISSMDSCLNAYANYRIHNTVLSLEVLTENNHALGFDLLRGFLSLFSARFIATSAKLSMSTALTTTAQDYYEAVRVNSEAKEENKKWQFHIGVRADGELDCGNDNASGIVSGGVCLDHVRATPINDLIRNALRDGVRKVVDDVNNKYGDKWRSRVVQKPDAFIDHFYVPVGNYANVKEGDVFMIYNIEHSFSGIPCDVNSRYLGFTKTTRRPLAHVRVIDTHPFSSLVQVIPEYSWDLNGVPSHKHIQYGALVEIANPNAFGDRILSRSLELGIIRSLIMPMNTATAPSGGGEAANLTPSSQSGNLLSSRNSILLNITPLICENLREVANQNGFYIYSEDRRVEIARCGADEATLERIFWEDPDDDEGFGGNTLEGLIRQSLGDTVTSQASQALGQGNSGVPPTTGN